MNRSVPASGAAGGSRALPAGAVSAGLGAPVPRSPAPPGPARGSPAPPPPPGAGGGACRRGRNGESLLGQPADLSRRDGHGASDRFAQSLPVRLRVERLAADEAARSPPHAPRPG